MQAEDLLQVLCQRQALHQRVVGRHVLANTPVLLQQIQHSQPCAVLVRLHASLQRRGPRRRVQRQAFRPRGLGGAQRLLPVAAGGQDLDSAGILLRIRCTNGLQGSPEGIAPRVLDRFRGGEEEAGVELAVVHRRRRSRQPLCGHVVSSQCPPKQAPRSAALDDQGEQGRRHRHVVPPHVLQQRNRGLAALGAQRGQAQREVEAMSLRLRQPLEAGAAGEGVLVHL
mmetsp:Transcript_54596/g.159379  ORF Transcript_54596/g.159379 Transcript_54596/m.159379 type:complete len:226 (-) Transcript_54596:89-766(-)